MKRVVDESIKKPKNNCVVQGCVINYHCKVNPNKNKSDESDALSLSLSSFISGRSTVRDRLIHLRFV